MHHDSHREATSEQPERAIEHPIARLPINEVVQGDCVDVLKTFPETSIDLIFADPPYNLQLRNTLRRPDQSLVDAVDDEWDQFRDIAAYDTFTRDWLTECRRVLKDDGTLWVIGSYHNIFRVGAMMMDIGYWILNDVVWHKTNPMPNFRGTRFQNATETLIWAKKSASQKRYTFHYHAMKHLNEDKQMHNVWSIPVCTGAERIKVNGKKAHSTQKPEALLYRIIVSSSSPGDVVLDPFFGSGTTGAVAKKLQRAYVGIERDAEYIAVARSRIDGIVPPTCDDAVFATKSKRSVTRVTFGQLIENGYLQIGQTVYAQDRTIQAIIKADSHLSHRNVVGSIHQVAALIQGRAAANGWEFWSIEDSLGNLVSIDTLRDRFRADHGLD